MFSVPSTANADSSNYDFNKEENAAKWHGLFVASLRRVLEQLHPSLNAGDDALLYVESLCLHLLGLLCAKPSPHSISDIAERVGKTFPNPIEDWALKEAHETVDKSKKSKKSVLPVEKIHSLLCKDVLQYKIDLSVGTFMVAVLEYISADILKLAGNYVKNIRHVEILREDIKIAMCADKVLMDMFSQDATGNNEWMQISPLPPTPRETLSYEDVVKELIHEEKQYQRELHMIIRVFREELAKVVKDPAELEPIFANITDIYELTVTLLGSLEDVIEMAQEESSPCVGNCFEELAEGEEFEVYSRYARDITSAESREALQSLLNRNDSEKLTTAGHGFREAVKFYLPKLLLGPIWHAFLYLDYVKMLLELSENREDRESFEQVQGLLKPMQCELQRAIATLPKESSVQMQSRTRRQLAIEKVKELQNTVDLWDKDMAGTNCNEFIRTDTLQIINKRNVTERKVYLFDGLMVMCKANARRQAITNIVATNCDYRLKEKFHMRRVEIVDRPDTEGLAHAFEIAPRGNSAATVVVAKSAQQKNEWMADLVMVTTKSMLDRTLDSILLDIEKKHPLRMPSPEQYRFAVPDAPDNIVLEERESTGVPLIKGATLCKLVERLTYHIYADPMFVRTFLTTYRSFCTPIELLTLLLERFNIPDPSVVYEPFAERDLETDKISKNMQREDWKRYKKEYVQPVQFRVLNVLRHWVDHHFYDFDNDPALLGQLLEFLETVSGKSMRKWVDSVLKIVQRKKEQELNHKQITFAFGSSPPPIESHLQVHESEITLLTMHPIELARQLTLLEFELYKTVKPSELVGKVWTTSRKEEHSPNLLTIIKHTTNFTRWIEKSILDAENFEERVAMMSRAIEVMTVLLELNNFNSVISIASAIASAAVFRLNVTRMALPLRLRNVLDDCMNLTVDHARRYQEKLRSINPPCVPFFGMYLTNILHLEEGNLDLLANTELINFSKRRKVAETIGEIQQYQNQPYCLKVDPTIRRFLEKLDPYNGLPDEKIPDLVWAESNRIEPKDVRPLPKFPRRWSDITLKSPGIKPRRQNHNSNNNHHHHHHHHHSHSSGSSSTSMSIPGTLPFSGKATHTAQQHSSTLSTNAAAVVAATAAAAAAAASAANATAAAAAAAAAAASSASTSAHNSSLVSTDGEQSPLANSSQFSLIYNPSGSSTTSSSFGTELTAESSSMHTSCASSPPAPMLPKRSNSITSLAQSNAIDAKPVLSPRSVDPHAQHAHQQQHMLASQAIGPPTATTACRFQPVISPKCFETHAELAESAGDPFGEADLPPAISPRTDRHSTASGFLADCRRAQRSSNTCDSAALNETAAAGAACPPIPLSPHVNVPNATHSFHAAPPPPLPPRVPRRDNVDLAQQRQAADAPILPPRDVSPPPLPPRHPRASDHQPPPPPASTSPHALYNAPPPHLHYHHTTHPHQPQTAPHLPPHMLVTPNILHPYTHHQQQQQQQQHHQHHHVAGPYPCDTAASATSLKLINTSQIMRRRSSAQPKPANGPPCAPGLLAAPASGGGGDSLADVAAAAAVESDPGGQQQPPPPAPHIDTNPFRAAAAAAAAAAAQTTATPPTMASAASSGPPPAPRRLSTTVSPRFSPGETTPRLPPKPKNFLVHSNGATMFPYPTSVPQPNATSASNNKADSVSVNVITL